MNPPAANLVPGIACVHRAHYLSSSIHALKRSPAVKRRWMLLAGTSAVAIIAATVVPSLRRGPDAGATVAAITATAAQRSAAPPVAASAVGPSPSAASPVAATAVAVAPVATGEFARLIERISEPGGYFDTDNLISNEASYLHVIGDMRRHGVSGGAYIGVGPDQNFSYIAAIQPRIAFILDIRRDNLLEHLLFKALTAMAPTRVEFLSHLFARPAPRDPSRHANDVGAILEWVDEQPADPAHFERITALVADTVRTFGLPLTDEEFATIRRFHAAFFAAGLDLRFTSFGRAPRSYYPSYRQLVLETDRDGRRANWLITEDSYRVIRSMQLDNRIVPVVGDLAGPHALREIGTVLRERGDSLSAFYASNVEFYLMGSGSFDRFASNLGTLPMHTNALLIRSVFGRAFGHPQAVSGYYSTQLLQNIQSMVRLHRAGAIASYGDLVYRDYVR
jgi:hypothetical protein